MNNQPLDKGRVTFIAEKYQSGNDTKNRYATVGRATKWPSQNGGADNVEIEIDTIPVGHTGSLKLFIFWDSDNQSQQQQQQQQTYQPQQQGGYQNQQYQR